MPSIFFVNTYPTHPIMSMLSGYYIIRKPTFKAHFFGCFAQIPNPPSNPLPSPSSSPFFDLLKHLF